MSAVYQCQKCGWSKPVGRGRPRIVCGACKARLVERVNMEAPASSGTLTQNADGTASSDE